MVNLIISWLKDIPKEYVVMIVGALPISELKRVMVHGLLHLLGYKDKSKSDKETMTLKENYYLERFD